MSRLIKPSILGRLSGIPRNFAELERSLQLLGNLRQIGWQSSLRRHMPVDREGQSLPWYTYPAIEWLGARLRPHDTVFEYGAGSSTIWYSHRVAEVTAVEHDAAWFEKLSSVAGANVRLHLADGSHGVGDDTPGDALVDAKSSDYVTAINVIADAQYDVIVIDGMERIACAQAVVSRLKADGLVVFDNSDRPAYREGLEYLGKEGLERVDFHGFFPCYGTFGCTSMFSRFSNRWSDAEVEMRHWGG